MGDYLVGYWSINGNPACRSPEASDCGVDFECSCTQERFEEQSLILLLSYPLAVVYHHVGESCPIYSKERAEDQDYMDALEERTRAKFRTEGE